jgi:hypothetical protein
MIASIIPIKANKETLIIKQNKNGINEIPKIPVFKHVYVILFYCYKLLFISQVDQKGFSYSRHVETEKTTCSSSVPTNACETCLHSHFNVPPQPKPQIHKADVQGT